jgi:transposase
VKGARGWDTLTKEKPPIFGLIERGVMRDADGENVKHMTIEPLLKATIAPSASVYIDEYAIYGRLES